MEGDKYVCDEVTALVEDTEAGVVGIGTAATEDEALKVAASEVDLTVRRDKEAKAEREKQEHRLRALKEFARKHGADV